MENFKSLKCAVLNISKGGRKGREPLKNWYPRWFCRMEAVWKSDYCLGLGLGEFRGWWCCVSGKQGLHLPLSCPVTDNSKLLMCRTGTGMLSFLCWTSSKNKLSGFSQHYTGESFFFLSKHRSIDTVRWWVGCLVPLHWASCSDELTWPSKGSCSLCEMHGDLKPLHFCRLNCKDGFHIEWKFASVIA